MAKYESGDIATYYFIVKDDKEEDLKFIRAWTDKKLLAEYYMEFHNCPSYSLKKITKTIDEIQEITEENTEDQIKIANVITRKREGKRAGKDIETIQIPVTETELRFIASECNTMAAGLVGYSYLNASVPFLKKKYQKALATLLLPSLIMASCHNQRDKYVQQIELDELMILFKGFPHDFG